ncbi:hypothetical protein Cri9333_0432 [Crinalium epipsammum PCC 9333]|uniref:Uncharacterized protein n=1 Tax=Crinalium epipsammum PCC 9333 TaxID=1173022 RepID=K9VTJ7_9CYAN|nr:hypothetical protein [Crinalium epipsammum]AFZ11403.1 hypothetical protein Cri9333_0432 [Crinalium epipsammum PCC 9333]
MSGYGNNDNSGWGGSSDNSESGWNSSGYNTEESGYSNSGSGYDNSQLFGGQDSGNFGADSPLTTDFITDPYQENPFEVNPMDNAWSESWSNPNPHTDYSHPQPEPESSYQSYYSDYDDDQLQLEP